MQALSRSVRIGQTKTVTVYACYLTGTVDDNHKQKHQNKSITALKVTGDAKMDPLYINKIDLWEELENQLFGESEDKAIVLD